eukprot:COSAG01_NODE_18980_length_1039_cov_2.059574_2_plen_97_part_00
MKICSPLKIDYTSIPLKSKTTSLVVLNVIMAFSPVQSSTGDRADQKFSNLEMIGFLSGVFFLLIVSELTNCTNVRCLANRLSMCSNTQNVSANEQA